MRAFWRWFEATTKLSTQMAEPLVVYHGTRGIFQLSGTSAAGSRCRRVLFHFWEEHANTYADHLANAMVGWNYQSQFSRPVEIGANVMPVYVRAANPLRVTDKDGPFNEPEAAFDYQGGVLVSSAKELGHDGVLYSRDKGMVTILPRSWCSPRIRSNPPPATAERSTRTTRAS